MKVLPTLSVVLFSLALSARAFAQTDPGKEFLPAPPGGREWKLIWQDEFAGAKLERPQNFVNLVRRKVVGQAELDPPDPEAQRDDDNFAYVAAWEFNGPGREATLHKEELVFENVHLAQRSYK